MLLHWFNKYYQKFKDQKKYEFDRRVNEYLEANFRTDGNSSHFYERAGGNVTHDDIQKRIEEKFSSNKDMTRFMTSKKWFTNWRNRINNEKNRPFQSE